MHGNGETCVVIRNQDKSLAKSSRGIQFDLGSFYDSHAFYQRFYGKERIFESFRIKKSVFNVDGENFFKPEQPLPRGIIKSYRSENSSDKT